MFVDVPITQPWYNMGGLDTLTTVVGLRPIMRASPLLGGILQSTLDQLTFGIVYNVFFFVINGLVAGKTFKESWEYMRMQMLPTVKAGCSFWIPANTVSLAVPQSLTLPMMSVFGFFWTAILALLEKQTAGGGSKDDEEEKGPPASKGGSKSSSKGKSTAGGDADSNTPRIPVSLNIPGDALPVDISIQYCGG